MEHDIDQYKKIPKTLATLAASQLPSQQPLLQVSAMKLAKPLAQDKRGEVDGAEDGGRHYDHKTYPVPADTIKLRNWPESAIHVACRAEDTDDGSTNRKCVSERGDLLETAPPPTPAKRQSLVVPAGKWQLSCPRRCRCCAKDTDGSAAVSCLGPANSTDPVYGGCLGVLALTVATLAILFYRHATDGDQHNCPSCPPWSARTARTAEAGSRLSGGGHQLTWSREAFREQLQLELNAAEHILAPIVEKIIRTSSRMKR